MAYVQIDDWTLKQLRDTVRKYVDQEASCESLTDLCDKYEDESPEYEAAYRDLKSMRVARDKSALHIAHEMKRILL